MSFLPINRQRTPCADKNDRLGWQVGFSLSLEGVLFGVRSNDPDLLERLRAKFPAHAQPAEQREVTVLLSFLQGRESQRQGVKNYHIVYNAWNRVARTLDLEEAVAAFEQELLYGVALHSQEKTYVSGPLVRFQEQSFLVLHSYSPDEWSEWTRAWKLQGGEVPAERLTTVDSRAECRMPWENTPRGLAPAQLLVLQKAGLKRPRWERLTAGAATLEMLRRTPAARLYPAQTISALAGLAQKVTACKFRCASPAEAARLFRLRIR